MPQPQPRQQPGIYDMHMLQRQLMLKQLQELRRHQQLQDLGDGKQQEYLNQLSEMNKQASRGQLAPLSNGSPIHDASQMFMAGNMSFLQRGLPPTTQGFPNGLYSQPQSRDPCSVGQIPQQLEYGTASARNNVHEYSHPHGLSHDSANVSTKLNDNQPEKPKMQSSDFGNFGNSNGSSDQLRLADGSFLSKQFFLGNNLFGQAPIQGFTSGVLPENLELLNTQQTNASAQELKGRQGQVGWPEQFPGKTTQIARSQGSTTLDPLEQKFLFNMDYNSCDASFGGQADISTGGFGSTLEHADYLSSFPSIQSGSWSALMQSAVAEASSSDTGLQEEWSGLSFQNTELSTDNLPSNFAESRKQQTVWVENNLQCASSIGCKPQLPVNDSDMSSGFPGFQQSGIPFTNKRREGMHSDASHESMQQFPRNASKWLDSNSQQNQHTEGIQAQGKTPEASMAQSYDQSFVAQRFGLRLSPPMPKLPSSSIFSSLQSSPPSGNSAATSPTGPRYVGNQLQRPQLPASPVATQSPQATLPGMASRLARFNSDTSQATSKPISFNPFGQQFPILEAVPVSQPSLVSGFSQQDVSCAWTNVLTQPRRSVTETRRLPSNFLFSADPTSTNLQTTQELHDQNSHRGTVSQEVGACSTNSQGFDSGEDHPGKNRRPQQNRSEKVDQALHPGGQESVMKHLLEADAVGPSSLMTRPHHQNFDSAQQSGKQAPAVSAKDLEAFGRSLKRSNLHPNYSLLHQVRCLNNAETDPSSRASDAYHGADSDLTVQQVAVVAGNQMMYGHNSNARDLANNGLNVASRLNSSLTKDVKMLSFSSEVGDDQSVKASSLTLLQETPQEMAKHGDNFYHSDNVAFNGTQPSQISQQMAPSWFKQYGTLKNGQMLPMYDARTGKTLENMYTNTTMIRVNPAVAGHASDVSPTTAATLAAGKLPLPYVLPPDVIDRNMSLGRSKKRNIAMSEVLPWHKEVTQGSKRLQTISMAEEGWAQAANRLLEKVEDEAGVIEGVQPLLRPKKRLLITTQLMQQVFRPAPAAILCAADASANYDSMAFIAAKLALGDACNLSSCSRSDLCLWSNSYDMMLEKVKTSENIADQYFSKAVEDFTSRAKKLESDLFRLDKNAIIDIRVEYQELEKFSLINRFAKFHCRGQPDAAATSSSPGTTPTVLKPCPQRYVNAYPMPRAVPEGVQCLSL